MFDLKSIRTKEDNAPKYYVLEDEGLKAAVQMAIWLQKPLLLTGAPGTGKTQLAYKIAHVLSSEENKNADSTCRFIGEPFVFHTKTTSTATDLFYYYDAVRHFQKRYVDEESRVEISSIKKKFNLSDKDDPDLVTIENTSVQHLSTAHPFIKLQALGKALLQAWGKDAILADKNLNDLQYLAGFDEIEKQPRSSVVLIDEIDKAPRDFPNDLLFEIENMSFSINELMNKTVSSPRTGARVLVIMTSNFEKNLPDAFLRRCLFYHIPFPNTANLIKIVSSRLQPHFEELYKNDLEGLNKVNEHLQVNIETVIKKFEEIRNNLKDKQPATAELLEWIKTLDKQDFFDGKINFDELESKKKEIFKLSLPILAKSEDDLVTLRNKYS